MDRKQLSVSALAPRTRSLKISIFSYFIAVSSCLYIIACELIAHIWFLDRSRHRSQNDDVDVRWPTSSAEKHSPHDSFSPPPTKPGFRRLQGPRRLAGRLLLGARRSLEVGCECIKGLDFVFSRFSSKPFFFLTTHAVSVDDGSGRQLLHGFSLSVDPRPLDLFFSSLPTSPKRLLSLSLSLSGLRPRELRVHQKGLREVRDRKARVLPAP